MKSDKTSNFSINKINNDLNTEISNKDNDISIH
jgi:hypothetical protein